MITPISPISPYYNPDVTVWYDPAQAKTILEQEKFPFDQEWSSMFPPATPPASARRC